MSRFILHTKEKEKIRFRYLMTGIACILVAVAVGFAVHSIGTAGAKSREVVLIYTQEELEQYLLDQESEEYNRNGRYRLEEDLDLGGLYQSIGTNLEPFTGTFDGNGYVISGLTRPLFGVMENAEVKNLFLSGAVITEPFTYFDGERYVDGYSALAAYAVDTVIRNCGMNGQIQTASPSEAEYQLEKASPADAEERKGPGIIENLSTQPEDENPEENPSTAGPANDIEETGVSAGESSEGPDAETTKGETQTGEDHKETDTSHETEPGGQAGHPVESGSDGENADIPSDQESAGGDTGVPAPEESNGGGADIPTDQELTEGDVSVPADSESTDGESDTSVDIEPTDGEKDTPVDDYPANAAVTQETAGYRAIERTQLMMKVPAVLDSGAETVLKASPSDATPSDAIETTASGNSGNEAGNPDTEESEASSEPSIEYIGNPDGDIYILVTADCVTVGGLVAETAGDTLITDCFTLVTIGSALEFVETWAGGITAILGTESRVENSYTSGLIDNDDQTGGFAAINSGMIKNSYSSMIIGESGTVRGAFTASGDGALSGCIYDRQMACADDERAMDEDGSYAAEMSPASTSAADAALEEADFQLKALNTAQMTGIEHAIPGNWYLAEEAYPQLEYFAIHDNETIASASRVSAIALRLPDGSTLANVIAEGQIVLPTQVDGQELQWEAEGNLRIDEENHVVIEKASVSPHEVPIVGNTLNVQSNSRTLAQHGESATPEADILTSQEESATPEADIPVSQAESATQEADVLASQTDPAASQTIPTSTAVEPAPASTGSITDGTEATDAATGDGRLKLSIGNATKTFALTVGAIAADEIAYADWAEIGKAVDTDGSTLAHFRPAQDGDGCYLIGTPEAMAWFGYKVNQGNYSYCAKLTADIDLFGVGYGGRTAADATIANIENALLWTSIGGFTNAYTGVFEGNNKKIMNLWISNGDIATGFFGSLGKNAKVMNLGIASGKVVGNADGVGGVTGHVSDSDGTGARIINCWNNASITSKYWNAGGIVGSSNMSEGLLIEGCYNLGTITSPLGAGGIFGRSNQAAHIIRNCYNLGTISAGSRTGGIQGGANKVNAPSIENCFNAGRVTGSSEVKAIYGQGTLPVKNCYYDNQTSSASDSAATGVTTTLIKSWAAAYALNGQSLTRTSEYGFVWNYKSTENNGYPYPATATLDRPESWLDIGKGVAGGLIKINTAISGAGSESDPYLIRNAEDLAFFAAKVNDGNTSLHARLVNDIDLTGSRYGGTTADPIPWYPIGTIDHVFQGTFDGNGKVIGYLKVSRDGVSGLFGYAGNGAKITGLGLDSSCRITSTGTTDGDGTAAFVGIVKSDGTSTEQITIQNCYNRAQVQGASVNTAAFVGGFDGTDNVGTQKIANCYNTGGITSTGGTPAAIAGAFTNGTGGGIQYCYWDSNTTGTVSGAAGGSATVENSGSRTTVQMKSDDAAWILNGLNANLNTGAWVRTDIRNDGYPVFRRTTGAIDWGIVGAAMMAPSGRNPSSSSAAGSAANPYLLWTAEDLAWFANQVNQAGQTGLCAEVMADINLYGGLYTGFAYDPGDSDLMTKTLQWIPIGGDSGGYTGTFNGNNHTVSVMKTEGTGRQGLFGTLGNNASVSNVAFSVNQLGTGQYAGGIAGYVDGTGVTITSCRNTGTLNGTADYLGGIVGAAGNGADLVIDGCWNDTSGTISSPEKINVGGILGGALSGSGSITIRNCYNRGNVFGGSRVGGIVGSVAVNTQKITGCYSTGTVSGSGTADTIRSIAGVSVDGSMEFCFYDDSKAPDARAKAVKTAGFGTWGMAFALNGEQLCQTTGISWKYVAGDAYPSYGMLEDAASWENVGEAAYYGLLAGAVPEKSGTAYQIENAKQLAWFAYQVNEVRTGISAEGKIDGDLTADIDLASEESPYISGGRLLWMPIGKLTEKKYTGSFRSYDDADSWKIYRISNLYIDYSDKENLAGLFGTIHGGKVTGIGLEGASVIARGNAGNRHAYAGGISGVIVNGTIISRCYSRNGSSTETIVDENANNYAGGIVGTIEGNSRVEHCYHMDSSVTGGQAYSYAGGIAGYCTKGSIQNCYNAGTLIVPNADRAGSIVGGIDTGVSTNKITQCYSNTSYNADSGSGYTVAALASITDTNAEIQAQADALNTVDGTEKIGTDRIWFTSLEAEKTKGFPTLDAPVMLSVPVSLADSKSGSTKVLDQTIPGAVYRWVHQENGVSQAFTITGSGTVESNYQVYGSKNANLCLGLKAGNADLGTMAASLTRPSASVADVSQITLFHGAAYTCPETRVILMDFAAGTTRYEVRAEIAGASGKILSVVLPTRVPITISPDGTSKTSYSPDIKLVNENDYPVEGSIKNLEPVTGIGYVTLQPVRQSMDWTGKTGQITKLGVKLGIDNLRSGTANGTSLTPSSVYYTPKEAGGTSDSWMNYRLKSGGTLWYRYFMEYAADPYYNGDLASYGYTVNYQFGVAEEDYNSNVHAEIVP